MSDRTLLWLNMAVFAAVGATNAQLHSDGVYLAGFAAIGVLALLGCYENA